MVFATDTESPGAANGEFGVEFQQGLEGQRMLHHRFAGEHVQADPFDA